MTLKRIATVVTGLTCLGLVTPIAPASAAAKPVNIIKDPGAESAKPVGENGDQVKVPFWRPVKGTYFTAVKYNDPAFLGDRDPGPTARGHNFFAGGVMGPLSGATQTDSLAAYASAIKAGKATFTLSGWFGGFFVQRDYATLTVVWENAAGVAVGKSTAIGDVTPGQRKKNNGLLLRSKTGAVPKTATQALLKLKMVRLDGEFNDGYADNLSLVIAKK